MLKAEFVNPFIKKTSKYLKQYGVSDIKRGGLSVEKGDFTSNGVEVAISVTGQLVGSVLLEFESEAVAFKLVEKMAGLEIIEWNELSKSAVNEFVNIVSGNSLTELEGIGYSCDISTPVLRVGKFTVELENPLIRIPFETEIGKFSLYASIVENTKKTKSQSFKDSFDQSN